MLVNKCRLSDEDSIAHYSHYTNHIEKKWKNHIMENRIVLQLKGKHKVSNEKRPSEGETPTYTKCFKCGGMGNYANDCKNYEKRCFKCGKMGQLITDCKSNSLTCFNCGEPGHISNHCQKSKKVQFGGNFFSLAE